MIGRWLLMDIGCLECGYPSAVVGTFDSPEAALAAGGDGAKLASDMDGRPYGDWTGEGVLVVFDLESKRKD